MFNFNYRSRWAVSNGQCIVNIDLLKECQTLTKPELKAQKDREYYISIDVARSTKESNNASAIAVLKPIRDSRQRIREIQAVNIVKLPNGLNFKEQSIICKKMVDSYNAKALIVDVNGLGVGLLDYLLDEQIMDDGSVIPALDCMNLDFRSDYTYAPRIVYGVQAQTNNTEMITNFISCIETKKLRLLEPFDVNKALDISDADYMVSDILPFLRTENFITEVQNLTVEQIIGSGKLKIGQLVRADKDIYSAICYGLSYIMKNCDNNRDDEDEDLASFLGSMFVAPVTRRR